MLSELGDTCELQQARMAVGDGFVLEAPSAGVRHEDSAKAGCQGGIDIRLGRVSYHPGAFGGQTALLGKLAVGGLMLLPDDGGVEEIGAEAGTIDFEALFFWIALGEESQLMAAGEFGKGLLDAIQKLDGMLEYGVREVLNDAEVGFRDIAFGEVPVAGGEIASEVTRAVAVHPGIHDLDFVENRADLLGRHGGVGEILAERVVGVEDEVLARQSASGREPAMCLGCPFSGATRLARVMRSRWRM